MTIMSTKKAATKQRKHYKTTISLYGDACVGKTQFLNRFNEDSFTDKYEQTFCKTFPFFLIQHSLLLGSNSQSRNLHFDNQTLSMLLADTCGSQKLTPNFYKDSKNEDGALVLFSIDRPESFQKVQEYLASLKTIKNHQTPIVLVGTKCDLRSSGTNRGEYERIISYDEAEAFARSYGLDYIETSAKEGTNVTKAFEMIARKIIKAQDAKEKESQETPTITTKTSSESSCSIF